MEKEINKLIEVLAKSKNLKTSKLSDGYHSFCDLYDHRNYLFILLCRMFKDNAGVIWRTRKDKNGKFQKDWFILGLEYISPDETKINQITYHLPMTLWKKCRFAMTIEKSLWDGHTSADIIKLLNQMLSYD